MDLLLKLWIILILERVARRASPRPRRSLDPQNPLKLLFLGYNGGRNTGADVRVHEMVRQISHLLGKDYLDTSVVTQNPRFTEGYFEDAEQIRLPATFPPFLEREIPRYDGLIACEGSMFKSKFADALTLLMIQGLGLAAASDRMSVGFGAEAGRMNPIPRWMTKRYCRNSLIIARSEGSQAELEHLGISADLGTDTAWTFQPAEKSYAREILIKAGWDGSRPVLGICPINPFWWPLKPSVRKAFLREKLGWYKDSHFRSYYFHRSGPDVERAFARYLRSLADGFTRFRETTEVFPILIAMEMVDERACSRLNDLLSEKAPVFSSRSHDMFQLVAILRQCSMLLSSRYHAIVCTMPALVPSAGISMDERIRNLMAARNHPNLVAEVDQADLDDKVFEILTRLHSERDAVRDRLGATVVSEMKKMARMGEIFGKEVKRHFPDFTPPDTSGHWTDCLPELDGDLQRLIEQHS